MMVKEREAIAGLKTYKGTIRDHGSLDGNAGFIGVITGTL